jgi:2-keto-4-pentenoate hydratase
LANKLAEHHQSLEAEQVVLPGSLTPIYPAEAGDRIEAEFETPESGSLRSV